MNAPVTFSFTTAEEISQAGKQIYREKFQPKHEQADHGKFLAIDVRSGEGALGDTFSEALANARQSIQDGLYYLMRIGYPGAQYLSTPRSAVVHRRTSGRA